MFDINDIETDEIIKAPFAYPGSKARSLNHLLEIIPYDKVYVEPFGGTGILLLNRRKSKVECFNDRHSGITDFYLCMQDPKKLEVLKTRIHNIVHSREIFNKYRESWTTASSIDRAFMWYYMVMYSFGRIGRNFGRATNSGSLKALRDYIPSFHPVHERLKNVQIENRDAFKLIQEFDSVETVFYLDPPYIESDAGCYKHSFNKHEELLDLIFSLDGYVAISGYSNELYDSQPWDDEHEWESLVTLDDRSNKAGKYKSRSTNTEKLWIKF